MVSLAPPSRVAFSPSLSDLLTVSETANEPPQDEGNSFNSPRNLAMEATYINHNFSQQCLRMVSCRQQRDPALHQAPPPQPLLLSLRVPIASSFPTLTRLWRRTWTKAKWRPSPTGEARPKAAMTMASERQRLRSVLRYRHWKLGEDIDLIVRCEHDAVMTGAKGEVSFINVKTLNEWDSRVRALQLPWQRGRLGGVMGQRVHSRPC